MQNGKNKLLWLIVIAMICVVLIMGVYGSEDFFSSINPFSRSGFGFGMGGSPNATPEPTATPMPSPTPYSGGDEGGDISPSPTPYPSPSPDFQPTYTMHLYVEPAKKNGEYVVSIMVIGNPSDLASVYAQYEEESGASLLLIEYLDDESGVYMTLYDMEDPGTWAFWATSATGGLSDTVYVELEEGIL